MRTFITIAILVNLASYANAQTVTHPGHGANGLTIVFYAVPSWNHRVERNAASKFFSFSRAVGAGNNPTATASAAATGTNFAYASARTSAMVSDEW